MLRFRYEVWVMVRVRSWKASGISCTITVLTCRLWCCTPRCGLAEPVTDSSIAPVLCENDNTTAKPLRPKVWDTFDYGIMKSLNKSMWFNEVDSRVSHRYGRKSLTSTQGTEANVEKCPSGKWSPFGLNQPPPPPSTPGIQKVFLKEQRWRVGIIFIWSPLLKPAD